MMAGDQGSHSLSTFQAVSLGVEPRHKVDYPGPSQSAWLQVQRGEGLGFLYMALLARPERCGLTQAINIRRAIGCCISPRGRI